jgi:hypothetical protein
MLCNIAPAEAFLAHAHDVAVFVDGPQSFWISGAFEYIGAGLG